MYIFQIMKKMSVLDKDNPKITPNKIILFIKGKKLSKSIQIYLWKSNCP